MTKHKSLIAGYILDGNGSGREIKWKEIDSWTPDQGILWIHMDYSDPFTQKWILKKSGIDPLTARSMTVEESRPRSVIHPESVLVFLRGVNLNPGEDPEDMVSIRIWVDQNRIITTRKRRLLSIDDIKENIANGNGPKTSIEFLTMLNDRLIDRMSDVVESIEESADELETEVLTSESHLIRPKIADIRRQSIMIRRYLSPQREALSRLYHDDSSILSKVDRIHIRESTDRIIRYIEDLDSTRERASITQEELMSRISEQMDQRMYLLSVVAVIFLPITFITGLLGINVGGIPGANYRWGFTAVSIILFVIMGILFWIFHRKKWI